MKRREYHGQTRSREYRVWATMITRCHNPKSASYPDYGGRGVTVCDEWRTSFAAFLSHIGPSPSPKHTIDRIDNERGYEPGNVRWEGSRKQQRLNSRATRWVTFNGETLCLGDWAARLGINRATLDDRLRRWPLDRAMTEPVGEHPEFHRYDYQGRDLTLRELASELGLNENTLEYRIRNWGYERAISEPLQSHKSRA